MRITLLILLALAATSTNAAFLDLHVTAPTERECVQIPNYADYCEPFRPDDLGGYRTHSSDCPQLDGTDYATYPTDAMLIAAGLPAGTTCNVAVTVYDKSGLESAPSDPKQVEVQQMRPKPPTVIDTSTIP